MDERQQVNWTGAWFTLVKLNQTYFRSTAQTLPDWPSGKQKLSIWQLAKKHHVPYTTLCKQIKGWEKGYDHLSGGKDKSKILPKEHEGKLNHWIPIVNANQTEPK